MMKIQKSFFISILLMCFACDTTDEEDGLYDPDTEDSQGNLVVINYSDYEFVLYSGTNREKILPATSEDFLVNISMQRYDPFQIRFWSIIHQV